MNKSFIALEGLTDAAKFENVLRDCENYGLTAIVTGAPGSGKTYLLNTACANRNSKQTRAIVYAITGFDDTPDTTGALRRYLPSTIRNIGCTRSGFDHLLSEVARGVLNQGLSLVAIDDADALPEFVLRRLFRMLKTLRQSANPFGLVLAGESDPKFWLPGFTEGSGQLLMGDLLGAGNWMNHTTTTVTSIRSVVRLAPLHAGACVDVLCGWSSGFETLRDRLASDPTGKADPAARALADLIQRVTLGNLDVLRLFSIVKNNHLAGRQVTTGLVEEIRQELVAPVMFGRMSRPESTKLLPA